MNNLGHEDDQGTAEPEDIKNPVDESASLKGKGWDILVGGAENLSAVGGEDPFDLEAGSAGEQPVEEYPFADDAAVDAILDGIAAFEPTSPAGAAPLPEDAFWDRGRGREFPEPSPLPGEPAEAPPRDLSPADLGYRPSAGPTEPPAAPETAAPPTAPVVETETAEGVGPGEEVEPVEVAALPAAGAVEVEAATPGGPISDGDIEALLTEPEAETLPPHPDITGPGPWPAPMPPTESRPQWLVPEAQEFKIHDPFTSELKRTRPYEPDREPDEEMEKLLITPERISALWDEIEETYDFVVADVRGHYNTTEQAIADLKKARELLLAGPENYDNAEELVVQVKARLRLEKKVRQWSSTRGTWLGAYLVIWFILLVLAILTSNQIEAAFKPYAIDWMLAALLPGFFGGLGGVVGALWVLIKHIAKQRDFDPIHTPWYVTNPFMGIMLGVVTYLVVRGGGIVLTNVAGISNELDIARTNASTALYLLCVIVGFQQNVLWSLIDRFINAILPDRHEEEKAATDTSSEPQG